MAVVIDGTNGVTVPAGATGDEVPQAQEVAGLVRAMVVGTVSQSGGVPTGAIIQQGTNANGYFVRFADGTQICAGSSTAISGGATVAVGSVYRSNTVTLMFAAAFSAQPTLAVSSLYTTPAQFIWAGQLTNPTTTMTGELCIFSGFNGAAGAVSYIAIGRWF